MKARKAAPTAALMHHFYKEGILKEKQQHFAMEEATGKVEALSSFFNEVTDPSACATKVANCCCLPFKNMLEWISARAFKCCRALFISCPFISSKLFFVRYF